MMQIDQFLELARTRRCIRRFKPDPIPDECIEKVLEAARWAMSGGNAQPWEFIVVKDPVTKNKIADMVVERDKTLWDIEKTRIPELRHPAFREGAEGRPIESFREAPVFILICGDPRTVQATVLGAQFLLQEGGAYAHFLKNVANATMILHLAIAACKLGRSLKWDPVKEEFGALIKRLKENVKGADKAVRIDVDLVECGRIAKVLTEAILRRHESLASS